MIYTKYMPGRTLQHASRNKRELQAAKELGFEIQVVSSDDPDEFKLRYPEYQLISDRVIKLNASMPRWKRYPLIIRNYIASTASICKLKTDAISCHDLDSLLKGWISTGFKKDKPKLVYDSHEFEIGRNKKRNKVQLWWVTHLERFLIKRCAFSIMVNDAIADEVQKIHKLEQRPIVVRSTPNLWTVDPKACAEKRRELLELFDEKIDYLLIRHGNVVNGSGIETLLQLLSKNKNYGLLLLGQQNMFAYLENLKKQIAYYQINGRVAFHSAVPVEELWQYVGAADVEMILTEPIVRSHFFVLPNKFFESIQSLTPIIASDMPEMKKLIDKYGIGLTCPSGDVEAALKCVERMRNDKAFYAQCKENLKLAKQELCWEKEKNILMSAMKEHL